MQRLPTAVLVFLLLLSVYLLTASGWIDTSDGQGMYSVAVSILEEGDTSVPDQWSSGLRKKGVDGQLYSATSLGIALLILPFAALGKGLQNAFPKVISESTFSHGAYPVEFFAHLLNPFVVALSATLLFLFARRLRCRPAVAVAGSLIYGLCTTAWTDSNHFFAHQSATAFLLLTVLLLERFSRTKQRRLVLAAGLTFAVAILVYMTAAIATPALIAYAFATNLDEVRQRRARFVGPLAALFAIGPLIAITAMALYNHARFGSPLETGYSAAEGQEKLDTPVLFGLYGLLFSSGKSVFLYSPPLVLALATAKRYWRSARPEALFTGILAATYLLFYSRANVWHGDWAWGPRYLSPVIPFAILGVALFLEDALAQGHSPRSRLLRVGAVAGFAALGLYINVPGVVVATEAHLAHVPDNFMAERPIRPFHEMGSEAHFLPRYSAALAHGRLAAIFFKDAVRAAETGLRHRWPLYGIGWYRPEALADGTKFRRSRNYAVMHLRPQGAGAHLLRLSINDGFRPVDLPAMRVWFKADGQPMPARSLEALPQDADGAFTLTTRGAWHDFEVELPAKPEGSYAAEIVSTAWQVGNEPFGVGLYRVAVDGVPLEVDGPTSWRETGFGPKNSLVHRTLNTWWVRVFYTDLPGWMLGVAAALGASVLLTALLLALKLRLDSRSAVVSAR